jgi:hypothetical protein
MKFEEHCAESIRLFGKPFGDVHIWLDEFAGSPEFGYKHRKVRHHLEGVKQIRKMFGDQAAEVAMQHIKSDLKQEGWTEEDKFPKNESEYKSMGLY